MEKSIAPSEQECPRILVVDDDPAVLKSIQRVLRPLSCQVFTAPSAAEGVEMIRVHGLFQVVVSDYLMPVTTGDKFLHEVALSWPDTRRVILSAYADQSTLLAAINEGGVHRYITKPWNNQELLEVIGELLNDYAVEEAARVEVRELAGKYRMLALTNQQLEEMVTERTTDLQHNQQQLQDSHVRLRLLGGHLEELREQERRAIAREIHDDLAQSLTAINLDVAAMLPGAKGTALHGQLNGVKQQVDLAIVTVQRILSALRPQVLDELGLPAALEWLVNDFSRRNCITTTLECPEDMLHLAPHISTSFYRVTQEALTNIMRHSGAYRVWVRIRREQGGLCLEIEDNGMGIPDQEQRRPNSFGLLGMQERATLCGGTFSVGCLPAGGTLVAVRIPQENLPEGAP